MRKCQICHILEAWKASVVLPYCDIFIEKEHVSLSFLLPFILVDVFMNFVSLKHSHLQWNPITSFCICLDSLFMDREWQIVDLLIGSRPLIGGMNHHFFSWHTFYTKFPSLLVSFMVQLSKIHYSWLWEIKYCSHFPAAETSNPHGQHSRSTFSAFSFFLLFRGHCYSVCVDNQEEHRKILALFTYINICI